MSYDECRRFLEEHVLFDEKVRRQPETHWIPA